MKVNVFILYDFLFQLVHHVTQKESLVGNASLTVTVRTKKTVIRSLDTVIVGVRLENMGLVVSLLIILFMARAKEQTTRVNSVKHLKMPPV